MKGVIEGASSIRGRTSAGQGSRRFLLCFGLFVCGQYRGCPALTLPSMARGNTITCGLAHCSCGGQNPMLPRRHTAPWIEPQRKGILPLMVP